MWYAEGSADGQDCEEEGEGGGASGGGAARCVGMIRAAPGPYFIYAAVDLCAAVPVIDIESSTAPVASGFRRRKRADSIAVCGLA